VQHLAKAPVDELVGSHHLAGEVARKEEHRDHDAPQHVADHDLQEAEVSGERDAWNRDDGER
jgi:hypothetical protein